ESTAHLPLSHLSKMLDQHDVAAELIQLWIDEALPVGREGGAIVADTARRPEARRGQPLRTEIVEQQIGRLIHAEEAGPAGAHLEDVDAVGGDGPVAVADGGN